MNHSSPVQSNSIQPIRCHPLQFKQRRTSTIHRQQLQRQSRIINSENYERDTRKSQRNVSTRTTTPANNNTFDSEEKLTKSAIPINDVPHTKRWWSSFLSNWSPSWSSSSSSSSLLAQPSGWIRIFLMMQWNSCEILAQNMRSVAGSLSIHLENWVDFRVLRTKFHIEIMNYQIRKFQFVFWRCAEKVVFSN